MTDPAPRSPVPDTESNLHAHRERNKHLIPIILTLTALAVFAASLNRPLRTAMRSFAGVLSPLLIGCVVAYLFDPILTFFEYRLFRRLKWNGLRRGLSLFLTIVAALGTLTLLGALVIPRIYESLTEISVNLNGYIDDLRAWLDDQLEYLPIDIDVDTLFGSATDTTAKNPLQEFLDKLSPVVAGGDLSDRIGSVIGGLFNTFKNFLLGLFISFYILGSKEKRVAQIRKARAALFSEKTDRRLGEVITLADNTFGGFIYGKLLDCFIIGLLTFAMLLIFGISDYKALIAIIMGVTNIIPVFGLFIGIIGCALIVFVTSPSQLILFLVLMFILQQLDANVIAPKILGDNTGISSLCVIVAISVCAALWGIAGMIIGVPVFAVIIELIRRYLEGRLETKGEPTDTLAYYPADAVGDAEQDVYYEHSHLRYMYEHSKLKPKIDRIRASIFSGATSAEKKPAETAAETPPETPQASPADSSADSPDYDNTDPS